MTPAVAELMQTVLGTKPHNGEGLRNAFAKKVREDAELAKEVDDAIARCSEVAERSYSARRDRDILLDIKRRAGSENG